RRSILFADSINNATIPMGKLVCRTKAAGGLDQDAPYDLVDLSSNDTQLVDTNEFAVVFGDGYSAKDSFNTTTGTSTETPAVAFVRGEVQLKEETIFAANGVEATDTTERTKIRALLEDQGII